LVFFLAFALLSGCNNNPFAPNERTSKSKEKKDKDDDNNGYGDEDNDKSNWTSKQRRNWMDECVDELGNQINNASQAKQICSCVLEKMEKKYPDASDAENATEAEGEKWGRECTAKLERDNDGYGNDDNEDYVDRNNGGNTGSKESNRGNWSELQREQFIQGCATTAKQVQGFTSQQANSYCECMTRKVERKYSFQEAARLTAEDFQTQEWIDAVAECRSFY
jgi:hypothetical protein